VHKASSSREPRRPCRPGQPDWAKFSIYIERLGRHHRCRGHLAEPTAPLLGQFDQAGQLRYVARSHRLGAAAQRVLAAAQLRVISDEEMLLLADILPTGYEVGVRQCVPNFAQTIGSDPRTAVYWDQAGLVAPNR
jgi:hypothetical protein